MDKFLDPWRIFNFRITGCVQGFPDAMPSNDSQEITGKLQEIHEIELKITSLLKSASETIEILSLETDRDFKQKATKFLDELNQVQESLRVIFKEMANQGTLRYKDLIPYRCNLTSKEKELELDSQGVSLLLERVELSLRE